MKATWLVRDSVEIVRPPTDVDAAAAGADVGYDLLVPVRQGDRATWTQVINTIFLRGAPRALRRGGRVFLKAGTEVFWSVPVLEVLSDSDRISDITGAQHGHGPNLIVDLSRGRHHQIDASALPTPDGKPWHTHQGFKYVTPGCGAYVKIGPRPPKGAGWARSSIEVAVEHALAKHLPVDCDARRLRIHDGKPRPIVEVDICIPALGLVVEYDGRYWHDRKEARDTSKTARLLAAGLRVIRVRENLAPLAIGETIPLAGPIGTADDIARAIVNQIR